jgi:hypothetical protein
MDNRYANEVIENTGKTAAIDISGDGVSVQWEIPKGHFQ